MFGELFDLRRMVAATVMVVASILCACAPPPAVIEEPVIETPAEEIAVVPDDSPSAAVSSEAVAVVEPAPVEAAPAAPQYKSSDVIWIQERLQELGYYDGKVDGSVGKATRGAIRAYQEDQDLKADGQPTTELREFMWRNGG